MTIDARHETLDAGRGGVTLAGFAWFALAVLAAIPTFWFGFERLAQEWARPEFRFKAIVPFFSLFLLLQVLRSVGPAAAPVRWRWLGVVAICGALAMTVFGNLIDVDDFVFTAIVVWIAGMIVVCFGLPGAFAFWAPVASLFLMVPVPRFVMAPIHRMLESAASELGMGALRVLGIPARVEGQLLDFGVHRLPIAEATAGLVNFLPVMLAFFFFATFYRGPLWTRLMPLILAAPVMVLMTALRIAGIGLAVERAGPAGAERVLQLTGDWVFLGACILVLLALVMGAKRLVGQGASPRGRTRLKFGGMQQQLLRIFAIRTSGALIGAALVTSAVALLLVAGPSRPVVPVERDAFRLFPPDVAGWSGTSSTITPDVGNILNADDHVLIDFIHPEERTGVNFWSAFYYRQDYDKGGIHSPQDCLPADGWNIVAFRPLEVEVAGHDGMLSLNRAIIEKEGMRALVYYWFDGRGRRLSNERLARMLVKTDALIRGRSDGALVRYVTAILPGEAEADADARIQRLLGETIDLLPRFVPA